jgi:hypothetical protein
MANQMDRNIRSRFRKVHGHNEKGKQRTSVVCKHCGAHSAFLNVTRMRQHLGKCTQYQVWLSVTDHENGSDSAEDVIDVDADTESIPHDIPSSSNTNACSPAAASRGATRSTES